MKFQGSSRFGEPAETLYLVDISSFIYRAFYAIKQLKNSTGEPTNAVYGVASMLSRLVQQSDPHNLIVVYDSKEPSFRKEIYTEYKAHRPPPPDDLVPQFQKIEELIALMGMHSIRISGVEADDLIATMTRRWCDDSKVHRVVIVSGDKDLMQLVDEHVLVWDTMKEKIYGAAEVEEKFGVSPKQIHDYLALTGDSSDNIPGVQSIGPKTAVQLLKLYNDLQSVLEAAKSGSMAGKKGELLREHSKEALLSAELVTLKEDLPVKFEKEDFKYSFMVTPQLIEFLERMEFKSLIEKWNVNKTVNRTDTKTSAVSISIQSRHVSSDSYVTINKEADFQCLLEAIEQRKEFAIDLETTSLNPRAAAIVGIAISCDLDTGYYIPVGHTLNDVEQLPLLSVLERLRPFLENPLYKKIGQNIKYDWSVFFERGIKLDGIGADTMLAAYVLDPTGRHGFDSLCVRYLQYTPVSYEEVCGKGKDQIGFNEVPVNIATRYAAEDALYTLRLWEFFKPRLISEGLMDVFSRIELPLVSVLGKMECQGVHIDCDWLRKLSGKFEWELKATESKIHEFSKEPINLNSPKQIAKLLFEDLKLPVQSKTKTGYSTDAKVLSLLVHLHEVPKLLLEYREISKLKGTYVDTLPEMLDGKTGRIHGSFHQTVTATGRLSSSNPNLQNIPIRTDRGRLIRRAFVPSPENLFVSADYSQIELRVLAHMSGDKDLIDSFNRGEDIHKRTAGELFGIPQDMVSERQRSIAKAINFGLMYGKTAFGLSQELNIPRYEAKEIIDRYFERYSAVKRFLDSQISEARQRGWTHTLAGRQRPLPEINSKNHLERTNAERMAMNTPIQGTAADLMKLAMINLDEELERKGFRSKLIIQVHDELVLDCPKDEVAEVTALLTHVMENAMKLSVPLKVNTASGENWQDL